METENSHVRKEPKNTRTANSTICLLLIDVFETYQHVRPTPECRNFFILMHDGNLRYRVFVEEAEMTVRYKQVEQLLLS